MANPIVTQVIQTSFPQVASAYALTFAKQTGKVSEAIIRTIGHHPRISLTICTLATAILSLGDKISTTKQFFETNQVIAPLSRKIKETRSYCYTKLEPTLKKIIEALINAFIPFIDEQLNAEPQPPLNDHSAPCPDYLKILNIAPTSSIEQVVEINPAVEINQAVEIKDNGQNQLVVAEQQPISRLKFPIGPKMQQMAVFFKTLWPFVAAAAGLAQGTTIQAQWLFSQAYLPLANAIPVNKVTANDLGLEPYGELTPVITYISKPNETLDGLVDHMVYQTGALIVLNVTAPSGNFVNLLSLSLLNMPPVIRKLKNSNFFKESRSMLNNGIICTAEALTPVMFESEKFIRHTVRDGINHFITQKQCDAINQMIARFMKKKFNFDPVKLNQNTLFQIMIHVVEALYTPNTEQRLIEKRNQIVAKPAEWVIKGSLTTAFYIMKNKIMYNSILSKAQTHPVLSAMILIANGGPHQTVNDVFFRILEAMILIKTRSPLLSILLVRPLLFTVQFAESWKKKKGISDSPALAAIKRQWSALLLKTGIHYYPHTLRQAIAAAPAPEMIAKVAALKALPLPLKVESKISGQHEPALPPTLNNQVLVEAAAPVEPPQVELIDEHEPALPADQSVQRPSLAAAADKPVQTVEVEDLTIALQANGIW